MLKLIERLEARQVPALVMLLGKHPRDLPDGIEVQPDFGHFRHVRFQVIPYRRSRLWRPAADARNWLHQVRSVLKAVRRHDADILYVDRGNLALAAVAAWCGRRVVWRCLGVMTMVLRRYGHSLTRRALGAIDWLLLKAPFSLVIGTLEGSPYSRFFRSRRQRDRLVLLVNGADRAQGKRYCRADILSRHGLADSEGPLFVSIGRLVPSKHVMQTLEAYRLLASRGVAFRALLGGYGPLEAAARDFVREHGLQDHVAVIGRVQHVDVAAYTGVADVYLSLSDGGAMGNTTLEALVAGCCIVALAPDPSRGIDSDLVTVLPDDAMIRISRSSMAEALAATLSDLSANRELRARYRRAALGFADRAILSWDDRLDMEIQLMAEVAARTLDLSKRPGFRLTKVGELSGPGAPAPTSNRG